MKNTAWSLIIGLLLSIVIFALLFYFFLFANPLGIHQANQLQWIPMLIVAVSTFAAGMINKKTPAPWLPILLLPLFLLIPFNYFYFPFVLIVLLMAVLLLVVTRASGKNGSIAWMGALLLFLVFLFKQPLIIENQGFDYAANGELVNATTLWSFGKKEVEKLPNHNLLDIDGNHLNLQSLKGKTYFITFWANWCAPCMEEKPALEELKQTLQANGNIEFIDISYDQDISIWKKYLLSEKPAGRQLFSAENRVTSRLLGFAGIPMHLIVDETGNYKRYPSFRVARNMITTGQ